jgi:predicted metal-dependent hydrolase
MSQQLEPIFRTAHLQLKPRTPIPAMRVEFFPFAGLTHTARFRQDLLWIRVSDLLADAPQHVLQALARILLAKLYRRSVSEEHHVTYRSFILGSEMQERARHARTTRGRRPRPAVAKGRWQDLATNFDRLNAIYFDGRFERPRLAWSGTRSRRILGRYDATHNTIFVSRLFDSPRVPDFVLDYVLYHEMLHVRHPSRAASCRLINHTPEFRAEERRFKDYKKATEWIRQI